MPDRRRRDRRRVGRQLHRHQRPLPGDRAADACSPRSARAWTATTAVDRQLAGLARLLVDRAAGRHVHRAPGGGRRRPLRVVGAAALDPATEARAGRACGRREGISPRPGRRARVGFVAHVRIPAACPPTRSPTSWACAPVAGGAAHASAGRLLAVLGLGRRADAPAFNDDDRALAEEIAGRAALALDNALLLADERATAAAAGACCSGRPPSSPRRPRRSRWRARRPGTSRQLLGDAARVGVYELDRAAAGAGRAHARGRGAVAERPGGGSRCTPRSRSPRAVRERRAAVAGGRSTAGPGTRARPARGRSWRELGQAFGLGATVALPLTVAGRVVGVIGIGFPAPRRFPPTERAHAAGGRRAVRPGPRPGPALPRRAAASPRRCSAACCPPSCRPVARLALAAEYLPGAAGTQAGGDWYDVVELDGQPRRRSPSATSSGRGPPRRRSWASCAARCPPRCCRAARRRRRWSCSTGSPPGCPARCASTAACLVLDWAAGTIRWARAGHPPPLLLTPDGGAVLLDGGGAGAGAGRARPAARTPRAPRPSRPAPRCCSTPTVSSSAAASTSTTGLDRLRRRRRPARRGRPRAAHPRAAGRDAGRHRPARRRRGHRRPAAARRRCTQRAARRPGPAGRRPPARRARWAAAAGLGRGRRRGPAARARRGAGQRRRARLPGTPRRASARCDRCERAPDGSVARLRDGRRGVAAAAGGQGAPGPRPGAHRAPSPRTSRSVRCRRRLAARSPRSASGVPGGRRRRPAPATAALPAAGRPAAGGGPVTGRGPRGPPTTGRGAAPGGQRGPGLGTTAVRDALRRAHWTPLPRAARPRLDLTSTSYLASAGVGMLLELRGRRCTRRGTPAAVRGRARSVPARVLALSGVGRPTPRALTALGGRDRAEPDGPGWPRAGMAHDRRGRPEQPARGGRGPVDVNGGGLHRALGRCPRARATGRDASRRRGPLRRRPGRPRRPLRGRGPPRR